jgi:hypothetical protein
MTPTGTECRRIEDRRWRTEGRGRMTDNKGEKTNWIKERAQLRKVKIYGFIGERCVENLHKWEEFFRREYPQDEGWFGGLMRAYRIGNF